MISTVLSFLAIFAFYGGIFAVFVQICRNPNLWKPKYPEWVYGMQSTLRQNLKNSVVLYLLFPYAFVLAEVSARLSPQFFGLLAVLGLVLGGWVCTRLIYQLNAPRRDFERTYDEGVEVTAKILNRHADTLSNPRFVGGSGLAAEATVAVGAAMILNGQWQLDIEFEIEGQKITDRRKVDSQIYYRFLRSETLPILVRPEAPKAWIPLLERRAADSSRQALAA